MKLHCKVESLPKRCTFCHNRARTKDLQFMQNVPHWSKSEEYSKVSWKLILGRSELTQSIYLEKTIKIIGNAIFRSRRARWEQMENKFSEFSPPPKFKYPRAKFSTQSYEYRLRKTNRRISLFFFGGFVRLVPHWVGQKSFKTVPERSFPAILESNDFL